MTKKNIRKIPATIFRKIDRIDGNDIIVFSVKVFSKDQILEGKLDHLRIQIENDKLLYPESIIPPAKQGKYSNINVNGLEIIRKDLPKETHYNSVDTPNWGDSWNGTHTVDLPYEKYPRDFVAPKLVSVKIESSDSTIDKSKILFKFEIDTVLNKNNEDFQDDLFTFLNILQENVGGFDIAKAGVSFEEQIKTLDLNWELLPPGSVDHVLKKLFKNRQPTPQEVETIHDRYEFFEVLKPKQIILGTSGMQRYFGALIKDDLVVFENVEYGNAIYIMFDNWVDLSQKSRIDLLSGRYGKNFEHVIHVGDWKSKVLKVIKNK